MRITNEQREACQRELERCAGRPWVSYAAIPEKAHSAFEAVGWGKGGDDIFTEQGMYRVSGNEVALAAAWCLAISAPSGSVE